MRAKVLDDGDGDFYAVTIKCPGCGHSHSLPTDWVPEGRVESKYNTGKPHWQFNGNLAKPTFHPSILAWWEDGETKHVCHSFVANGCIQFLDDCTHALAGKTVDLPEIEGA